MYTLKSFYRSKEWEGLRSVLMNERITDNGDLICEICGQPITRRYDCIAHHKVELTDENVNDFSISLNPENVELIHFRCHNRIHGRFEGFQQKVFLVYGPPLAGKHDWVESVAEDDDLILDIDHIWEAICKSDRYHKPTRLKRNVFGIRDCIIDQIRTRTGMWRNAYVIGTYPLRTDRDRMCDLLRAEPVFIDVSLQEIKKNNCVSYKVMENLIEDWFENYTE